MHIILNGESTSLQNGTSLAAILERYRVDVRKTAVERNREIVPRSLYDTTVLQEGDALEIITFIGGG